MSKWSFGIALAAVLGSGCSVFRVTLTPPIVSRCESAGMKGCDDLAEGVALYIEGSKEEARKKFTEGVAVNSSASVRSFAETLKTIVSLPGIDKYAGPIKEIVDILAGEADKNRGPAASAPAAARAEAGSAATSAPTERYRSGSMLAVASPKRTECTPFGVRALGAWKMRAICSVVTDGPVLVTDIETSGTCPDELFVLVTRDAEELDHPRWFVLAPSSTRLSLHGAAFAVRADEHLVVGAAAPDGALKLDPHCAITWAAREP